jgi:hypothetical protein
MKFIAVLRTSESHGFPPPALHEGMAALGAEATRAGVLVDTAGLLPAATATRVSVADGELAVADGPFDDDPAPLAAYAIYDVASRDEVVKWTRRFMDLHRRTWPGWAGSSEIRQVFGPEGQ